MSFATKYRPKSFDDVIGQPEVCEALSALLNKKTPPTAFLLSGPSGTGKTTLARIVGRAIGVSSTGITEVDAATWSGVAEAKTIKDAACVPGFGKSRRKLIVLDECHAMSKNAWDSWLKVLEEPPAHLTVVLCTTDIAKVPKTVKTRCVHYQLQLVSTDDLHDLLVRVAKAERVLLGDKELQYLARASDGSPRQALTYLEACAGATDRGSVRSIVQRVDEDSDDGVIALARLLASGSTRPKGYIEVIGKIPQTTSAESVRLVITAYMVSCLRGPRNAGNFGSLCAVLDAFGAPCNPSEGMAPIYRAIGRLILE